MTPKPGFPPYPGSSMEGTYLLAMRGPVYRRHDPYPGFRTELENLVGDGKGKGTSGRPMRPKVPMRQPGSHCSIVARKRSNARGAKGAGHPRQDGVNGQPEELLVLAEAGRLPRGGTSRMNREVHVRICERLGVKIPGATRPVYNSIPVRIVIVRFFGRYFRFLPEPGSAAALDPGSPPSTRRSLAIRQSTQADV